MSKAPRKAAPQAGQQTSTDADTDTANDTPAPQAKKVKTVRMVRADGKTADVHPDEVGNFAAGGYVAE